MVLSYKKSKAGNNGGAGNYYVDCQAKTADDYYSKSPEAREAPGEWFAANRSKAFGVADQAKFAVEDSAKFRALVNGFDPRTGLALTQNSGDANRISLHDLTFSAPKSVSAAWSQADANVKTEIERAQREAVREALTFLSDKAGCTRRGKGSTQKEHVDLCGALFEHGSSRLGDPQLHTHGVILNVAERTDGSAGSIETKNLFRYVGSSASIYHSTLSTRLAELGFEIDKQDRLFELSAVPEQVNAEFSQRREAIENRAKEIAAETGMSLKEVLSNQDLMQTAAMETRDQKGELTRSELEIQWRERGDALGFGPEQVNNMIDKSRWAPLTQEQRELLTQNIPEQLTAFTATFSEPQLYTAVAVELIGRGSREDIELAVAAIRERCLTVEHDGQLTFTTKEMVLLESQMLQTAGEIDSRHVMDSAAIERAISERPTMTEEQGDAVRHVLMDEKRVSVLQGAAGAGKTFSLKTVADVYREAGYGLHAIAAPWSAAENLRKETGLDSHRAIAGWLMDIDSGAIELNEKSVVVVDEAGMVSARDMAKIVEAASKGGAKVVLTGDEKQLNSIGAGDALRTISRAHGGARIDDIQRQKNPDGSINTEHVAAIKSIFNGDASLAIKAFDSNIHLHSGAEQTNLALFEAWAASKELHPEESHLMIAKRNVDVAQLNQWAHERLKESGVVDANQSLSIRAIDSSKERPEVTFCKGDSVQFRNNQHDLGVYNRTKATIENIDGPVMHLKTDEGQLVKMDTRDSLWYVHGERELALQHSYAVTCYGSQGLSIDKTFVRDSVNLTRREAAVALSRHKSEVQVFSDRTEHAEKIVQQSDKMDWRPIAEISDHEIKGHIQKMWEYSPEKTSTLDFKEWRDHEGQIFEPEVELEIEALEKAGEAIRTARESSKGTYHFQRKPEYELGDSQLPKISAFEELKIKSDLRASDISLSAINRAVSQGVLSFSQFKDEELKKGPTFIGRDENNRVVSARTEFLDTELGRTQFATSADGPLRHRHPPVLEGDPQSKETHVVRDGVSGLQIWTDYEKNEKPLPTVIIAGHREDSLVHTSTQERLAKAQEVTFHKQPDNDPGITGSTRAVERAQLESVKAATNEPVKIVQPAPTVDAANEKTRDQTQQHRSDPARTLTNEATTQRSAPQPKLAPAQQELKPEDDLTR